MMIGTMTDASTLADRLAMMPDQMLPRLAQQYKTDAITLSLILGEKNRRDRVRQSIQAQAGGQPQPKVNDQIVASMQQPSPGIAGLPAPTMQGMADGGIAGYAEGGEVEHYQVGGVAGDLPAGFRPGEPRTYVPTPAGEAEDLPLLQRLFAGARETGMKYQVEQARARLAAGYGTDADRRLVQEASGFTAATPQDIAAFDAATNLFMTERAAKKEAPKADTKADTGKTAPKVDTGRREAAPTVKAPSFAALDPVKMTEEAMAKAAKQPNPFATEIEGLGKERVAAAEAEVSGLEAIQKQFADIYKGRRERLGTREAEIGKLEKQAQGLALLQAGAAMMSTPGKFGAGLGRGLEVGTRQYAAGMDKVRDAQEKLSEARDRLDEIEAQRGELSARELFKARTGVKNASIAAREALIKANMDNYNVNRDTALKMVDNQIKIGIAQIQEQGATNRANIAAGAQRLPGEAQMAMMLGTGATEAERLRSGLAELAKFKAKDGGTNMKLLEQFIEAKKADPSITPESFLTQAAQVMLPTTAKPPPNAVVRTQP